MDEMTVAEVMDLWKRNDNIQRELKMSGRHGYIPYTAGAKMFNYVQPTSNVNSLFDQFCNANTLHIILKIFYELCDELNLSPGGGLSFYKDLRIRLTSWRANGLWLKLDKRAAHPDYNKNPLADKTTVLIIGAGPCGLRTAIEILLLGSKAIILEKRDRFSRNNVLHLWPFVINDLKTLGAKKFFGKFCAGSIDHISIRTLQCVLLKVALILGVEIHPGVTFHDIIEPTNTKESWHVSVSPNDHHVSKLDFDVLIGADGSRNTVKGFEKKEFRGKLAVAITANFVNRNTSREAHAPEIGGVAFIFNQKFFRDLYSKTGIDLENIVYYKDETHYFVMTAKKHSLLSKGVLIHDRDDPTKLLHKDNVNEDALIKYALEAANVSTEGQLHPLEFAHNNYGRADVSIFDFTSMFQAVHACKVRERFGKKILMGLVGDSLLEPFWPTGSGCPRGFLSAMDAAWMIKNWMSQKMTPIEVIAERESVYQRLSQTTAENLYKNFANYSIDPTTRYPNLDLAFFKPKQVQQYYDGKDKKYLNEIIKQAQAKSNFYELQQRYKCLLNWLLRNINGYRNDVEIANLLDSWRDGLAMSALIHKYKPELIKFNDLNKSTIKENWSISTNIIEKEFGIIWPYKTIDKPQLDEKFPKYLLDVFDAIMRQGLQPAKMRKSNELNGDDIKLPRNTNRMFNKKTNTDLNYDSKVQQQRRRRPIPSNNVNENNDNDKREAYQELKRIKDGIPPIGTRGQNKVSQIADSLMTQWSGTTYDLIDAISNSEKNPQNNIVVSVTSPDTCYFCHEPVYLVEKMTAENTNFHRSCFKCYYCCSELRMYQYKVRKIGNNMRFFCPQHMDMEKDDIQIEDSSDIPAERNLNDSFSERCEFDLVSDYEEREIDVLSHNFSLFHATNDDLDENSFSSDEDDEEDEEIDIESYEFSEDTINRMTPSEILCRKEEIEYHQYIREFSRKFLRQQLKRENTSSSDSTEINNGINDADNDDDDGPTPENRSLTEEKIQSETLPNEMVTERKPIEPSLPNSSFRRNRMDFFLSVPVPVKLDTMSLVQQYQLPKLSMEKKQEEEKQKCLEEEERLRKIEEERIQETEELEFLHKLIEEEEFREAEFIISEENRRIEKENLKSIKKMTRSISVDNILHKNKTKDEAIYLENWLDLSEPSKHIFSNHLEISVHDKENADDCDENTLDAISDITQSRESVSTTSPLTSHDEEEDCISVTKSSRRSRCDLAKLSEFSSLNSIDASNTPKTPSTPGKRMFVEISSNSLNRFSPWNSKMLKNQKNSTKYIEKKENVINQFDSIINRTLRSKSVDYFPILQSDFKTERLPKIFPKSISSLEVGPGDVLNDKKIFENEKKSESIFSIKENECNLIAVLIDEGTSKEKSILVNKDDNNSNINTTTTTTTTTTKNNNNNNVNLIEKKKIYFVNEEQDHIILESITENISDISKQAQLLRGELKELSIVKNYQRPIYIKPYPENKAINQTEKVFCRRHSVCMESINVKKNSVAIPIISSENKSKLLLRSKSESSARSKSIKAAAAELEAKFNYSPKIIEDSDKITPLRPKTTKPSCHIQSLQKQITDLEISNTLKPFCKATENDLILRGRLNNIGIKRSISSSAAEKRDNSLKTTSKKEEIDSSLIPNTSKSDSSSIIIFDDKTSCNSISITRSNSLRSDENENNIEDIENTKKQLTFDIKPFIEKVDITRNLDAKRRFVSQEPEPIRIDTFSVIGVMRNRNKLTPVERFDKTKSLNIEKKNEKQIYPWTPLDKKVERQPIKTVDLNASTTSNTSSSSYVSDRETAIDVGMLEFHRIPPKPPRLVKIKGGDERQMKRRSVFNFLRSPAETNLTNMKKRSKSQQKKVNVEILNSFSSAKNQNITKSPPIADRKLLDKLSTSGVSNLTSVPTASEEFLDLEVFSDGEGNLTEEEKRRQIKQVERHLNREQKKHELKQMREAQQLQRNLQEVEEMQRKVEKHGAEVESKLRSKNCDVNESEKLLQDWFNIVYERNQLVRLENELMLRAKELELEDRQRRIESQLRKMMLRTDDKTTAAYQRTEAELTEQLMNSVEERSSLVEHLEEERQRYAQEEENLRTVMESKGYLLNTTPIRLSSSFYKNPLSTPV